MIYTYEWFISGQGRLDGAFCDFTESDKMDYLTKLNAFGVVNIEMEATIFGALTHHAGIRAAIVCVTLLDRLKGDQVCPLNNNFKIKFPFQSIFNFNRLIRQRKSCTNGKSVRKLWFRV